MTVFLLFTFPVFWTFRTNPTPTIFLLVLSLLWMIYQRSPSLSLKFLFFGLSFPILIFSVLHFNGLVNARGQWDPSRTIWSDAKFPQKISRLQTRATYVPFRVRPLLYSSLGSSTFILARSLDWLWLDKLAAAIGIGALLPLIVGMLKPTRSQAACVLIFFGITAAVISRNPNSSITCFLLLPYFVTLVSSGLNYLSHRLQIIVILLNFLFLVSP